MQFIQIVNRIYSHKLLRISIHFVFWMVLLVVRLYLTNVSFNFYRNFNLKTLLLINLSSTVWLALFYYLLVYLLMPLIGNKRYLTGTLGILIILIAYTIADTYAEFHIIRSCKTCLMIMQQENSDYFNFMNTDLSNAVLKKVVSMGTVFSLLFVLSIPFSIKMALKAFRSEIKTLELSKDNLQLEFNFLKAQLNPHFLFNSMNNIYGLILSGQNDKSAALVARLSGLLRYILYDSNQYTMPLDKEVNMIYDYIELEKVRLNDTLVMFNVTQDNVVYELPPLLLVPLIENAFKFSPDDPDSLIKIQMEISSKKLHFTIENRIDTDRIPVASGGIGLSNFKKRLDLYYYENYIYQVSELPSSYCVNLTIQLP